MAVKTAFSIKRVILLATSITVLGGMVSAPAAEAMVTTYQSARAGRLLSYERGACAINVCVCLESRSRIRNATPSSSPSIESGLVGDLKRCRV